MRIKYWKLHLAMTAHVLFAVATPATIQQKRQKKDRNNAKKTKPSPDSTCLMQCTNIYYPGRYYIEARHTGREVQKMPVHTRPP